MWNMVQEYLSGLDPQNTTWMWAAFLSSGWSQCFPNYFWVSGNVAGASALRVTPHSSQRMSVATNTPLSTSHLKRQCWYFGQACPYSSVTLYCQVMHEPHHGIKVLEMVLHSIQAQLLRHFKEHCNVKLTNYHVEGSSTATEWCKCAFITSQPFICKMYCSIYIKVIYFMICALNRGTIVIKTKNRVPIMKLLRC